MHDTPQLIPIRKISIFMLLTCLLSTEAIYFDYTTMPDTMDSNAYWQIGYSLTKLAEAMLFASVVLLTRHWWVTALVLLTTKVWVLCNLVYFRANHLFITWQVMRIASNLHGFESSISTFLDSSFWILSSMTLLYIPLLWWHVKDCKESVKIPRMWFLYGITLLLAAILSIMGAWQRHKRYIDEQYFEGHITADWFNPLVLPHDLNQWVMVDDLYGRYIQNHSIHMNMLKVATDLMVDNLSGRQVHLTPEEQTWLNTLVNENSKEHEPLHHLVFILVESLTTWPIDATDVYGQPIMPHLQKWLKQEHVWYAPNMKSQVLYGMSGDGQLITQTGLLPLLKGVACMEYGGNAYPNFAHFYPDSYVLNPSPRTWNKTVTTASYGYKHLIEPEERDIWNDSLLFDVAICQCEHLSKPTCLSLLTISSHAPFTSVPATLTLSDTLPADVNAYLQSLHYTDLHMGRFLAYADTARTLADATIVITSDHRILKQEYTIPLIIKGPQIPTDIQTDTIYQCDVFPTILQAIGQDDYYWKGVGVGQLADSADRVVPIEREVYQLSEKLIKMNYFSKIK